MAIRQFHSYHLRCDFCAGSSREVNTSFAVSSGYIRQESFLGGWRRVKGPWIKSDVPMIADICPKCFAVKKHLKIKANRK